AKGAEASISIDPSLQSQKGAESKGNAINSDKRAKNADESFDDDAEFSDDGEDGWGYGDDGEESDEENEYSSGLVPTDPEMDPGAENVLVIYEENEIRVETKKIFSDY